MEDIILLFLLKYYVLLWANIAILFLFFLDIVHIKVHIAHPLVLLWFLSVGATLWPTQSWCSIAGISRVTWLHFFSTRTSTWGRSTYLISAAPLRKCTTTPDARFTMQGSWTWCLGRESARHPAALRHGTRRRRWTAGGASRAACCRRSCRSWGRLCSVCCAVRRRLTPPSAPADTWSAARTVLLSCRSDNFQLRLMQLNAWIKLHVLKTRNDLVNKSNLLKEIPWIHK